MAVFKVTAVSRSPSGGSGWKSSPKNGGVQGHLFLNPNERVIDMMNDQRGYVAFEHGDGTIEIISK